jgi:hypothetical protein
MHINLIQRVAVLSCFAICLAPSAAQSEWPHFTVGSLDSFSFGHAHHPDGRFIFGKGGTVSIQNVFDNGSDFTIVANPTEIPFDPAFIAVRSSSSALIGGGGFFVSLGLLTFNPSDATSPITPSITGANPQAFAGVWWTHPTSGREGWLLAGGNGPGAANAITFVSADGSTVGQVTGALSRYSGGIAVGPNGDVFTVLSDLDDHFQPTVLENEVLRFTADQIDAAVEAILDGSASPIPVDQAANPFRADASGSIAVDALGRLWIGGFQIPHLQVWDPTTGKSRRVSPLAATPAGFLGAPSFSVQAFTRDLMNRISFLAHDSFYSFGSDLILGYETVDSVETRSIEFATSALTVSEDIGTVTLNLVIDPPATTPVTVPITLSGTATNGVDFTLSTTEVICTGSTAEITMTVLDDNIRNEPDETVVLTLGRPSPHGHAGLGVLGSETFTLTIQDNDIPPRIATTQTFPLFRVGAGDLEHPVQTEGAGPEPTRWSATGLPRGLRIDTRTGVISGTPTRAGDYDRVVIKASNAFGTTTSVVYLITVEPLPAAAVGQFSALIDREVTPTEGLGGKIDLITTSSSSYSGAVIIGNRRHRVRGMLNFDGANPTANLLITRKGSTQTVPIAIDADSGQIEGSWGAPNTVLGWRVERDLNREGVCHVSARMSAPIADEVPQGSGFARLTLRPTWRSRVVGRLADNTSFTASVVFNGNGDSQLYRALYRGQGSLLGAFKVSAALGQATTGDLSWSKPTQTRGALYRSGWPDPLPLSLSGGRYRSAAGATLPLNASPILDENATLTLSQGGIEEVGSDPSEFLLRILSVNRLRLPAGIRLKIQNRTGHFRGRAQIGGRSVSLQGLLIPDMFSDQTFDSFGEGFFILPTSIRGQSQSGRVSLVRIP